MSQEGGVAAKQLDDMRVALYELADSLADIADSMHPGGKVSVTVGRYEAAGDSFRKVAECMRNFWMVTGHLPESFPRPAGDTSSTQSPSSASSP